jgi:hypothetical protein
VYAYFENSPDSRNAAATLVSYEWWEGEETLPSRAQAAYGEGDAFFGEFESAEVGFGERRGGQAVEDGLQGFGGCRYRIQGLRWVGDVSIER